MTPQRGLRIEPLASRIARQPRPARPTGATAARNTFPPVTDKPQGPFPLPGGANGYILPVQPVPSVPKPNAGRSCLKRATLIAEKVDTAGRHVRQIELCPPHCQIVIERERFRGLEICDRRRPLDGSSVSAFRFSSSHLLNGKNELPPRRRARV